MISFHFRRWILLLVLIHIGNGLSRQTDMKGKIIKILPLSIDTWETGHELPDVVNGSIFSRYIFIRVQNVPRSPAADDDDDGAVKIHLRVASNSYLLETNGPDVQLQPRQHTSLYAPLVLKERAERRAFYFSIRSCPFQVHLSVRSSKDNNVELASVKHRLLCRDISDRFTFVYLDVDGSPQIAAAKFPAVLSKHHEEESRCPTAGCAVLVSTHGMDVTAQRQADCYQPKPGIWVLAPHGRGTHGVNWQGPGHWTVFRALSSLAEAAKVWPWSQVQLWENPHFRVIWTGHSNGGFGAWFFGTHYPDLTIGVAPLSGMSTLGTTELPRPARTPSRLWEIDTSSIEEYRNDALARNLMGKFFIARAGQDDRIIHPQSTSNMAKLFNDVSWERKKNNGGDEILTAATGGGVANASIHLLAGKGHWWWDTKRTNDGGVMDDKTMKRFWKRALKNAEDTQYDAKMLQLGHSVEFLCSNLLSCGSRAGVRMTCPHRLGYQSKFSLQLFENGERDHSSEPNGEGKEGSSFWKLETNNNVDQLEIDILTAASWLNITSRLELDGTLFEIGKEASQGVHFCRGEKHRWHWCEAVCDTQEREGGCTNPRQSDKFTRNIDRHGCSTGGSAASIVNGDTPMRKIFSSPFLIVYGTQNNNKKVSQMYLDAAVQFANEWAAVAGGVTSILSDDEFLSVFQFHVEKKFSENVVLFGGCETNKVASLLSVQQHWPIMCIERELEGKQWIEGGFQFAENTLWERGVFKFTKKDIGVASLIPFSASLGLWVAGTTRKGFELAVQQMKSHLFVTNSWQHRVADYVIVQSIKPRSRENLASIVATGYWGRNWEYLESSSFLIDPF